MTSEQIESQPTDWRAESAEREARIRAKLAEHGIEVAAEFIPWSKSRSYKPGGKLADLNLNWRVTLKHAGRDVLSTNYSAGIAHCPAYNEPRNRVGVNKLGGLNMNGDAAVRVECEHGKTALDRPSFGGSVPHGKPILPDPVSVIYGLLMDAEAIDSPTYEDWAGNFGYDDDSRKGEAVYRACLEIGLKLRAGLGERVLAELREVYEGY